ncbi:MAG: hypothetical protein JWM78_3683 [Verrucomicrobiaceae bacterium]|nr:hypothetical protein [Verrucomicrobiaceae bacterium]
MSELTHVQSDNFVVSSESLNASYLALLEAGPLGSESVDNKLRYVIGVVSGALNVARVSIWNYGDSGNSLTLTLCCDHRHGQDDLNNWALHRRDVPNYFNLLARDHQIAIADLSSDVRAFELHDSYIKPLNIGALLVTTLRNDGEALGIICIEHSDRSRIWNEAEKLFTQASASLIAQIIGNNFLRAKELQLRLMCDYLPIGIVRTDLNGRCTYVNYRWRNLTGMAVENCLGDGWLNPVAADDRQPLQRRLINTDSKAEQFQIDFRLLRQGQVVWISSKWVLERNSEGIAVGLLGSCSDRTREKLSLQRLHNLTTLQQAIIEGANHSIITTDLDGVITSFNRAAEMLLGYSEAEMIGRSTPDIFHAPNEIERRAAQLSMELQEVITPGFDVFTAKVRRGFTEELEWTYLRKDGTTVPVSLSISALRGEGGSITGYLGIAADLTERRLSERILLENEQRYRAVFEGSGDALFLMSNDTFIDCNQTTLQMFGCSRDDIVGVTPLRFSPSLQPDGRDSLVAASAYIEGALHGKNQYFEWLHCRLDRTPFEAEVTLTCVQISGAKQLVAVVRDISARKQAERELASVNELRNWRNQVGSELSNLKSIEAVGKKAIELLVDMSGAYLLSFYQLENSGVRIIAEGGIGVNAVKRLSAELMYPSENLLTLDKAIYIENIAATSLFPPHQIQHAIKRGTRAAVLVPLFYQGLPQGLILLEYKTSHPGFPFASQELEGFAINIAFALASAQHLEELAYRAEHDSLTQLANRAVLQQTLASCIASREPLALMLLDLDRFKEVNDTLGHHIGDKLLCELSVRLKAELDKSDALLCRLGGDEFAVLLRHSNKRQGLNIARDLLSSMRRGFVVDGITLEIGVSIGIACFPQHGTTHHDLLRAADVAMYAAKRNSLGVVAYAPKLDGNSRDRLRLMSELTHAIRNNELVLHYQPKILLSANNAVSGFEALVRWQHPRLGLLAPAAFVPMAEISDVIHALTLEVVRQALTQQNVWRAQGQPLPVAINLSTRNLLHAELFNEVKILLRSSGADPKLLEFEITETTLMQDPANAIKMLEKFAAIGVNIAIDDFGTGYSSLAYLRRLPLHALKIDRTFVTELSHNVQDQVIVRSIITLAHNLNLQVVAEGVEDQATLAMLCELGCDCAQGYLFARPLPAIEIDSWRQMFFVNQKIYAH